jgi:hypothetical protein
MDILKSHTKNPQRVTYELDLSRIAGRYYFDNDPRFGRVLKSDSKVKRVVSKNEALQKHTTKLYQDFLEILAPFHNHLIPPNKWMEILDADSEYSKTFHEDQRGLIIQQFESAVIEHANKWGFDYSGTKAMRNIMKSQGLDDLLFNSTVDWIDEDDKTHILTSKSILLTALTLYDGLKINGDEVLIDDVLTNIINQHEAKVTLDESGALITVTGYWACLWWSFAFDENRMKAIKCKYCGKINIRTISAKFCDDVCRASFNNKRYKLKRLIDDAEKMPNDKERTKVINKLKKALKLLEDA